MFREVTILPSGRHEGELTDDVVFFFLKQEAASEILRSGWSSKLFSFNQLGLAFQFETENIKKKKKKK